MYIGGTAIADLRRFDELSDTRTFPVGFVDDMALDGTAPGGGIRIGTFLHPLWSLELSVDAAGRTRTTFANPYAAIYPQIRLPELSSSGRFVIVSTAIGFHPAKRGPVRLGYLGGISFVRGTYESNTLDVGNFLTFDGGFASAVGSIGLPSQTLTFPNLTTVAVRRTDNAVGAVVGFEAAIDATPKLAVVPGIRTIVFSNRGRSVFLIRPEVGVRWAF